MLGTTRHLPIRQRVSQPGHIEMPVILGGSRPLGIGGECCVRLPEGTLEEMVISEQGAVALVQSDAEPALNIRSVELADLQLLVESARIRFTYAHDRHFAVYLSGIRTLPHPIEAVYQKMLPQPSLRFLRANDPGAGKAIIADLLFKALKLREAISRVLVLWWNVDEMKNDKFDAWFQKQDYNTREMEYDICYVNGDNSLEYLRRPDEMWQMRLMFEAGDV